MKTITFYSYKGGAGRTLALANTAVFAALGGMNVVALDFDLEAPGLGYKLYGNNAPTSPGLVGYLRDAFAFGAAPDLDEYLLDRRISVPNSNGGTLRYLPAGRAPSADYFHDVRALRLDQRLDDGSALEVLDRFKLQLGRLGVDLLLIDASAGISSSNRVTTHVLGDAVVAFTLDIPAQLEGTRVALQSLQSLTSLTTGEPITIHTVVRQGFSPSADQAADRSTLARVSSFLAEPAANLDQTVTTASITLLHHEPQMAVQEYLSLNSVGDWVLTPLHLDYQQLVEELLPADVVTRADRAVLSVEQFDPLLSALWTGSRLPSRSKTATATEQPNDQSREQLTPEEAFRSIVVEFSPSMYRAARSIVRDGALAEDVVRESIFKAWKSFANLPSDTSQRSWLLRITHNTAISTLRKRRPIKFRDPAAMPETATPDAFSPDERLAGKQIREELAAALDRLDDLSRTIVVLRYMQGMGDEDIADALQIALPTVKIRLSRALGQIRTSLSDWT